MTQSQKHITILHSQADQFYHDRLIVHLSQLLREGLIELWSDDQIHPGSDRSQAINQAVHSADILLLLISADFLASDICDLGEMKEALKRHQQGDARVIPVILRPCSWQSVPFGELEALPRGGQAITTWANEDEAFFEVEQSLRKLIRQPGTQFTSKIPLRAKPSQQLGFGDGQMMLTKRNFFDVRHNPQGQGINHWYVQKDHQIIIDEVTRLMWQRSGSSEAVTSADAQEYIDKLNKESFGGFNDWRLPTLEEVMSLVEPQISTNDLYLADLFDGTQTEIWTADTSSAAGGWVVKFNYGYFDDTPQTSWYCYFVRAVRSSL